MDVAKSTLDGKLYTAAEFSRLAMEEMVWMRRMLQCPECGSVAFFRNSTLNGNRVACFGARPHAPGCKQAAHDTERELNPADPDALYMPSEKIVVDFGFGSPAQFQPASQREVDSDNLRSFAHQSGNPVQRRLSTLLRLLVNFPEFRSLNQPIEVHGCADFSVANFFVPVSSASESYIGKYRGYWGTLSDVRIVPETSTIWFNCSGSRISFCLDARHLDELIHRYRPRDEEDFAGAYILVIGGMNIAENGKLYCVIDRLDHMAIKYT